MARNRWSAQTEDRFPHREHRSKKGRSSKPDAIIIRDFKRKKEEILLEELDHTVKDL